MIILRHIRIALLMVRHRLVEIFGRQPLGQVELLLAFESIAVVIWVFGTGGDCTFRTLLTEVQLLLPGIKTGRILMGLILTFNVFRIWAVVVDNLLLRCWIARLNCFGWAMTLLTYLVVRVNANELPIYAVGCLANFWLAYRFDEQLIYTRARRNAGTESAS